MNRIYLLPAAAAIALLGACEAHVGNDAAPVDANSTAENRAENGRVSIEAPGFSLKLDLPESVLARADMDSDNPLFYPGASFGGIHVQGARDAGGEDQVELRFTTSDAIDRVAAWYRDPARRPGFTVATDNREGETIVLAGTAEEDQNPFTLRLTPRGGGTEARLLLTDRD